MGKNTIAFFNLGVLFFYLGLVVFIFDLLVYYGEENKIFISNFFRISGVAFLGSFVNHYLTK